MSELLELIGPAGAIILVVGISIAIIYLIMLAGWAAQQNAEEIERAAEKRMRYAISRHEEWLEDFSKAHYTDNTWLKTIWNEGNKNDEN